MAVYNAIKYNVDYQGKAGSLIPIATTTITSGTSAVNFTSGINSDFNEYMLIYTNVHPSQDGDGKAAFQVTTDGSNFNVTITSTVHYMFSNHGLDSLGVTQHTGSDQAQGTSYQPLNAGGVGADNDQACAGWIRLFNPASTTFDKSFLARDANYQDSDYINDGFCAGYFNTTSAITGISFAMTSGNVDSGKFQLFGVH